MSNRRIIRVILELLVYSIHPFPGKKLKIPIGGRYLKSLRWVERYLLSLSVVNNETRSIKISIDLIIIVYQHTSVGRLHPDKIGSLKIAGRRLMFIVKIIFQRLKVMLSHIKRLQMVFRRLTLPGQFLNWKSIS